MEGVKTNLKEVKAMVKIYFQGQELPVEYAPALYSMVEEAIKSEYVEECAIDGNLFIYMPVEGFYLIDKHSYKLLIKINFLMSKDFGSLPLDAQPIDTYDKFISKYNHKNLTFLLPADKFNKVLAQAIKEIKPKVYPYLHIWLKMTDDNIYELDLEPFINYPIKHHSYQPVLFGGKTLYVASIDKDLISLLTQS